MGDILAKGPCEYSGALQLEVNNQDGSFSDHVAFHSRWEGNPHGSRGEGR